MKNSFTSFVKSAKLFEVLMIFIGITLSMQFDNWNEARKERIKEKEILSTIYVELKLNQEDLLNTIKSFDDYYIKPLFRLDSCLQCKLPIQKELYEEFTIPMGGTYLSQKLGAYENFKHNSSLLVRNNNLKIALFDYYEIKLKWIEFCQKSRDEIGNSMILPLFVNLSSQNNLIAYNNYLSMRTSPDIVRKISLWKQAYENDKNLHTELQPILDQLILDMEAELISIGLKPDEVLKNSNISLNNKG